ncbi:MAG: TonB family protein [Draconibacterium sp.]
MKHRILPILFLLFLFSQQANAQVLTGDKILTLKPHPTDNTKFIAEFYDKASNQISERWEMGTTVAVINVNNYNELLKKHLIFPNGTCNLFYLNSKPKAEIHYINGFQRGKQTGMYPTGEVMFISEINKNKHLLVNVFYKNGNDKKIQEFGEIPRSWDENAYYPNGQKQYTAHFDQNILNNNYESFYLNGTTKRKAKFENGELKSTKCYDEEGNKIDCPEFEKPLAYPGGWNAFLKELEQVDWSFNQINSDTTNIKMLLEIDTAGHAKLESYQFEHADSIGMRLKNCVASLKNFSPTQFDGFPQNSYLSLTVPISKDSILLTNTPTVRSEINYINRNRERRPTYYIEYPNPVNKVYLEVDKMPTFQGGEKELRAYLSLAIKYPVLAQENGIEGKVYVAFIVEKDGSLSRINVAKGIHPDLDQEAMRVIRNMPNWNPGTLHGKPVRAQFVVPINFQLVN